ncbi:MAG: DUF1566 domain-containing protein [Desulfobacterales bacterium]|nr:DUF1566 domain-containing protein [Desulfobacterales bacterium]
MKKKLVYIFIILFFINTIGLSDFQDNGDGTVADRETGLVWEQGTGGAMTWENALIYCESLSLGGKDDWRLPSRNELQSIIDYTTNNPSVDIIFFPDTELLFYWSSTTDVSQSARAWYIDFENGDVSFTDKTNSYYVRAVRSGQ